MRANGLTFRVWVGMLLGVFTVSGCGFVPAEIESRPPEVIRVMVNGQEAVAAGALDLLPYLGLTAQELDTLQRLTFRLESEEDISPLLFLGYAQDVTVIGEGPPVRIGTLVPAQVSAGWPEIQFFKRQEGYAPHLPISLKTTGAKMFSLEFSRLVEKPTPRMVRLISPSYLNTYANRGFSHFINGLFQGMVWVLILYHLLLFWSVREASYLWYCAYMVCISALTLGDVGYWQRGLFQDLPLLGWHLFQLMQYVTGIMTLVFMRSFVDLKRLSPSLDRTIHWFITGNFIILGLLALWYFPTRDGRGLVIIKFLIIPYAAFGVWVCYKLVRSGDVVGRYFAVAGAFTAVAVALNAGAELFFPEPFPGTDFTRFYWIQSAVILHLLTFALGMGYRRRQKDLELQRTRELDHLKNRFYTNITHEFRTPLTVILGMADQIKGDAKTSNLIKRNAYQLLRLINQLLGLSRLEAGQLRLKMEHGEVVVYLRYLAESFHSLAIEKGLQLTFYSEADAVWMDFDREKLQHIVSNLLSNAIKFTPEGGKVVLHVAQLLEGGKDNLQIKVMDTGIGIPAADLAYVFDRFYQVDGSSTRENEGTGIGLAYVQELSRLLDGTISVSSEQGKGTTFRLLLPVRSQAADEATPSLEADLVLAPPEIATLTNIAPASAAPDASTKNSQLPLVLLVDDNADIMAYINTLLESDYQTLEARDGAAGLAAALEQVPDLIVSDIMMPRLNGYEMCRQLKSDIRTSHVPVILLTAKVTQEDKLAGLECGADAFLTKPFNRTELLIRVENLLANRQKMRQYYAQGAPPAVANALRPDQEAAFLHDLEAAINERLDDTEFNVPELAAAVTMSQSQVYRKLKALVGKTPSQFIRGVRLRKGQALLADPSLNIAEVAYAVGFADPNYFSRTFNEEFGSSPSDWRRKRGINLP